jgi:hypothetical protein
LTLRWCNDIDRKWSGRKLARILGVSPTYIWKLSQQFKDGNLNVRSPLSSACTLEELGKAIGAARGQTRKMREQGLLRETIRQLINRVL